MTALRRNVLRMSSGTQHRLDDLASRASTALQCEVSRSAVLRAAIDAWLAAIDHVDPAQLIEAIRASLIKRGRKRT